MNAYRNNQDIRNALFLESNLVAPSPLLRLAISEDSNKVTDWMWYAQQVDSDSERCYCFKRALYINPTSAAASKGLQDLNQQQAIAASECDRSATNLAKLLQDWMRNHVFRSPDADV